MVVILNFVSFLSYCVERVLDACNLVNTIFNKGMCHKYAIAKLLHFQTSGHSEPLTHPTFFVYYLLSYYNFIRFVIILVAVMQENLLLTCN